MLPNCDNSAARRPASPGHPQPPPGGPVGPPL